MSAFAIAKLHSIERETTQAESQSEAQQHEIAKLAYALWQHRGCAEGSAERDWLEAEETVRLAAQRI
jgi:hypothetical protein